MNFRPGYLSQAISTALAVFSALLLTALLLWAAGASPIEAYANMINGAFGSLSRWADLFLAWIPLVLCAVGLTFTFAAGLWNIGIEGQMILGALFATGVTKSLSLPPVVLIPLIILAGMTGGILWACCTGLLKIYGRVHEIFGGLGLNFLAVGLTNYLIFGPWRQPGTATMSGTEFFPPSAWLPSFPGLSLGPVEILIPLLAITGAVLTLRGTIWGLKLKALGQNPSASLLMGVTADKNMLLALGAAGAMAGAAGAIQAIGLYHRLIPGISSGYGYLAILVVLLTQSQPLWILPVAFFFSAANKGSLQLPLEMHLDSSLGGILQESLVLLIILVRGLRFRLKGSGK
jgi:general nucleoside transport system permease protein